MNKLFSKIVSALTAATMTLFASSGSLQTFVNEIEAHAAETDVILGDVNDDDRVDVFDLCLMKRELIEPGTTSINKAAADVNADGVVDIKDVIEVQQFLLVERDSFTGSMRKSIEPPDTSVVTTGQPIETSMTAEMADKAQELGTAVNVYNYLYNNMRSEFYYGSRKGAIGTFEQGGGNDADLSSLLVAMLRYLGYDANYVTDIVGFSADQLMKWTNTDSIEAATKIYSCQGRENTTYEHEGTTYYFCDYTYVQLIDGGITYYLDVCFKEYEAQKNSIQSLSVGTSSTDAERILQKTDLNYLDSISDSAYNNALSELEGQNYAFSSKKIVKKNVSKFSTASPHLFNVEPTVAEALDESRCDMIQIAFNNNSKKTFHAAELYKKSVTVEYVVSDETRELHEWVDFDASSIFNLPPYALGQALSVEPVIKIDGQTVLTGPAIDFEDKQTLYISSKTGGKAETFEEELCPGELCCVVFDVGSISPNELSEAYSKSVSQTTSANQQYQLNEKTDASKVNEKNVYNANYLGSILRLTGVMYFSQLDVYTQTLAEKNNVNCEDTVKIGVFGFKPGVYPSKVQVAGEPYGIDKNGQFLVDIVSNTVSPVSEVSDSAQLRAFNMERGYISSELESAILEQIVGVESLSTVQLFKHAQEKGINIVSVSKDTKKKVSDLKISADDATRLQAEIDAGNTIITMEQSITVGGWTGIGYIVETADQSAQTFMISGNMNGGVCSSSVSVAAIIGIAIDEIWLVETVGLFIATLSAMTSLAFVPVVTLVLCVIAIEFMVFDIIETIANNYDYYMNGNEEAGTQVKINAAINVITFGVTKIGGAIISQAKNASNCAKYGKNVISGIKNSGFTTAEVNAQISKFSKLGCSQTTIETLLKNPKCMFLGDDILKVIGETGGSQRLLAEFVLRNGDDVAKGVVNLANKEGTIGIVNLFNEFGKVSQNLAKNGVTDSTIINKLQVDYVLAKSSSKIITEPVSTSSTTLRGIAGTPDPNDPRPIERQNEAAQLFADKGFDVEMLPDSPNGNGYGLLGDSCPDYLINGQAFDCYSPDKNTSVRNIWSTVKGKTETQARRIVINFDDSNKTLTELIEQFHTWDISTLDELFVVKDGEIIRVILK
ncbi:MAG TPA: dockerin type I domain-containing protein [Ruminococcus sp.]|nr:dockerin type I domain-containing protein [Ruminococcus sp.]